MEPNDFYPTQQARGAMVAYAYVEQLVDQSDHLQALIERFNEGERGELFLRQLREEGSRVWALADSARSKLMTCCPRSMRDEFVGYAMLIRGQAEAVAEWLHVASLPPSTVRPGALQEAENAIVESAKSLSDAIEAGKAEVGQDSAQALADHECSLEDLAERPAMLERYRRAVAPQIARLKATAAKWSRLTGPLF